MKPFQSMSLHLRLCQRLLVHKVAWPRVAVAPHRQLVTSISLQMPRRGRLQLAEELLEEEEETGELLSPAQRWAEFQDKGHNVNTLDDVTTITTFGSIRLDTDNLPREERGEESEGAGSASSSPGVAFSETQTWSEIRGEADADCFGLVTNEQSEKFQKFRPFQSNNEICGLNNVITRKFAFASEEDFEERKNNHRMESKTIPVIFDTSGSHDTHSSVGADGGLNYFDKLAFEESLQRFKSETINDPMEVKVDPAVIVAKEQMADPDLNFVDQNYFAQNIAPASHIKLDFESTLLSQNYISSDSDKVAINSEMLHEQTSDPDLNFIDQNFFSPSSSATNSTSNSEITTLNTLNQIYEERAARNAEVSASPIINSYLNTIVESDTQHSKPFNNEEEYEPKKTEEKHKAVRVKREKTIKEEETYEDNQLKETEEKDRDVKVKEKKVKKKKAKDQLRLSDERPALEYVRKLRKLLPEDHDDVHPKENIGKNLQDRMITAVSHLARPKVPSQEADEEGQEETVTTYTDVKKYKPPDLNTYSRLEVRDVLLSKIIFDQFDIVAIWKPYGLPMFSEKQAKTKNPKRKKTFSLEEFLPDIAEKVGCEKLHEVHRLDHSTTGVVLYAKTKEKELELRRLFKERKVKKNYLAICNGTPSPDSGIIDIPIGEGRIGEKVRKTLRPDYSSSKIVSNKKTSDSVFESAVTEYTVLDTTGNAALVSIDMETGRKHQIRLHMGLGLGTPILGDHKYSYPTQLGKPQKVMGDILTRMKLKKSKSRNLPIFLHARRIIVPGVYPNGNDLVIVAKLPHFFSKTLNKLKLKSKKY